MEKPEKDNSLNTGEIYSKEHDIWVDTDEYRDILYKLELIILNILVKAKKPSIQFRDGKGSHDYRKEKLQEYVFLRAHTAKRNSSPFQELFIIFKSGGKQIPLIERYKESFDLYELTADFPVSADNIERDYFDLLFAFALRQCKFTEMDDFLDYHIKNSFDYNFEKSKRIIQLIIKTYSCLLQPEQLICINEYFEAIQSKVRIEEAKIQSILPDAVLKNPEFTTARQVIAMHYIFEAIDIKGVDNSVKARFLQFLTNKNYKDIYDKIRTAPNFAGSDEQTRKDLEYVRDHFSKLKLRTFINLIDKDLDAL